MRRPLFDVNPYTFFGAAAVVLLFVIGGLTYAAEAERFFGRLQAGIANNTGWFFVLAVNLILAFFIGLIFTRWGRIRLGGADAAPEYGMGITFLHWGLHPWGIYALMSLTLAFYTFNRGLPLSLTSSLVALVLVAVFFITSSDSGSLVIDIITAGRLRCQRKPMLAATNRSTWFFLVAQATGRLKAKVVPWSTRLSTARRTPCRSRMRLAMARPRPVPSGRWGRWRPPR
jgi:choline-glycine betaine transporter